ncbi:MAG: MASE1 domain-containing protein [Rhodospirillaceae bacterium]|nr:MASE1 domain-containing protein [Rhodospirillaceae bacterium]
MAERTVSELEAQALARMRKFALPDAPTFVAGAAAVLLFVVTYVALDQLDHIGPTRSWPVAPWNPELGLCIAAALRWRARVYPLIFIAPVIAALMPGGYAEGDGWWTGVVSVLETYATVWLADKAAARIPLLGQNPLAAILLASLPCALVAATAEAIRLGALANPLPTEGFGINLARLWVGDVIGVFIVTPLFHVNLMPERQITWNRLLEITAQGILVLIAVWLAFGEHPRFASRYFYGVFPPMIWITLRFGMRGAIVMNALAQASMIISLSLAGHENVDVTIFQVLLLVLAASGLTLGMVVDQNRHATAQLHAREDELAASLKIAATGELAGTLAHELGHPLGAISNYASALNHIVREVAPNSEAPRIGAKLSAEIVRATDTLHRLRDFFRTGAMSFEPLDLVTLTKDAVALLKDRLERNGISPHIVIPSRPLMVLGDQIQLRAVIHNLMVNAVDALKPVDADARSMSITLRRHGDSAVLEVEDSGGGVAPDVKDHIFEPLVTTKKDGLGLGLSMSRSVVVAHGGSIELHDSTLGGARFTVTLPREDT